MDPMRDLVAAGGVSAVLAQDYHRFAREPAYLSHLRTATQENTVPSLLHGSVAGTLSSIACTACRFHCCDRRYSTEGRLTSLQLTYPEGYNSAYIKSSNKAKSQCPVTSGIPETSTSTTLGGLTAGPRLEACLRSGSCNAR
jgi:hypothetical protein